MYVWIVFGNTQGDPIAWSQEVAVVVGRLVRGDVVGYLDALAQLTADGVEEVALAVPRDAGRFATNAERVGFLPGTLHRAHRGQPSVCSVANDGVLLVRLNNKTRG